MHMPRLTLLSPPSFLPTLSLSLSLSLSQVLREMTVKSMVALAPKLRPATMQHVMRAFAKLQLDEEAAIRTNTTICLGKIASHIVLPGLGAGSREDCDAAAS